MIHRIRRESPDKTTVELVNLAGEQIDPHTFQVGWRWSDCIKPVVKTDSCQVEHVGYVISGRLHVTHEDGSEGEVAAGEVYRIAPGHDARVVGDEPAVFVAPPTTPKAAVVGLGANVEELVDIDGLRSEAREKSKEVAQDPTRTSTSIPAGSMP